MIIWISLAAVVVVIIVICLAALRFLRAEDSDPFDELPDEPRRPARAPQTARLREHAGAAAARRPPPRRAPASEPSWEGERVRGGRPGNDRVAAYRDQAQDRPSGPQRRVSQGNGQGRPAAAGARTSRPPRPAASAARSTDWESLSDVDYWAELAADKPMNGSEGPVSAPPPGPAGRRSGEPSTDSWPGGRAEQPLNASARPQPARQGRPNGYGPGQPTGPRPIPSNGRHGRAKSEPATESIAALARLGSPPPTSQPPISRPAAQLPAQPPVSQPRPAARPAPPAPLDDDPLTSPSFPAINTSDSRSYRARRADTQPGATRPTPAYTEPTQQFSTYPAAPDRASSPPTGYPLQQPVPAGNPYGSFVSQPAANHSQQAPAANHVQSQYSAYGNGSHASGTDVGWYGASVPGSAGQGQPGPGLQQAPNGYQQGHYPSYQAGQPEAGAYAQPAYPGGQHDQRGYTGQDAGYGADGYQPYPGGYGTGSY